MYKLLKASIIYMGVFIIAIFSPIYFVMCKSTSEPIDVQGNLDVEFIKYVKNCGATSGYNTKIYMLKKGDSVNFFTSPIIELKSKSPRVEWMDSHTIKIFVKNTDIYQFTNFYYIDKDKYKIVLDY